MRQARDHIYLTDFHLLIRTIHSAGGCVLEFEISQELGGGGHLETYFLYESQKEDSLSPTLKNVPSCLDHLSVMAMWYRYFNHVLPEKTSCLFTLTTFYFSCYDEVCKLFFLKINAIHSITVNIRFNLRTQHNDLTLL